MKSKNNIVIDENENILFLGKDTIKYLKRDISKPYFYPKGTLEKGNIFVFISNDIIDGSCLTHLIDLDKEKLDYSKNTIVIGSLFNQEIKPLIKQVIWDNDNELLGTIFERKTIKIDSYKNRIALKIDEQLLMFNRKSLNEIIVVADDNGIKYFTPDGKKEHYENMFMGEAFESYYDKGKTYGKNIRVVFSAELFKAVSNNDEFFEIDNKKIYIKYECYDLNEKKYKNIIIYEKEDLIDSIIAYNSKYKDMIIKEREDYYSTIQYNSFRLWGNNGKLRELEKFLQKGSITNATILLTGESGTGKTYLAREIHNNSKRKEKPFVHINCAAISYNLLESELFGYEEGAFTGAKKGGKSGLFDMAYGGTLFLDEIAEIPLTLQGKLLEVMQSKTYFRVGGTKKREIDVRFIAATNKDLEQMVKDKCFREDLFYRINVFPIEIPPLRDRIESIHAIVSDILPEICERLEIEPVIIDYEALEKIKSYSWPGNIRELENVLEKAAILCDKKIVPSENIIIPDSREYETKLKTLRELREECEIEAIRNAVCIYRGDKFKAAKHLGIGKKAMFDKIKKYGIILKGDDIDDFR